MDRWMVVILNDLGAYRMATRLLPTIQSILEYKGNRDETAADSVLRE